MRGTAQRESSIIAMTYPAALGLGLTISVGGFDLESIAQVGDALGGILGTIVAVVGLVAIWKQLEQSREQHAEQFRKQAKQHKAQALQDGVFRFAPLSVLRDGGASYEEEKDLVTALATFQIWGYADLILFTKQWVRQYLDGRNPQREPASTPVHGSDSKAKPANAADGYQASVQELLDEVNKCIQRYLDENASAPPKIQPLTIGWPREPNTTAIATATAVPIATSDGPEVSLQVNLHMTSDENGRS